MMLQLVKRSILFVSLASVTAGCGRIPHTKPSAVTVLLLPLPGGDGGDASIDTAVSARHMVGESIVIDSITLRPLATQPLRRSGDSRRGSGRVLLRTAVITTFQGGRYHPETIRALSNDTVVLARGAALVVDEASRRGALGIFIDFQESTGEDLNSLLSIVRTIRDSTRRKGPIPVAVVVPPGDTIGYPTRAIAQVAPLLVLRLHGEHRIGTAPGPLASPEWVARQIGLRASDVGANRLIAELPLYGIQWNRSGSARLITFADAQRIVRSEAGSFARDPASGFLSATGRDGWTIWIADLVAIQKLVGVVRQRGIKAIALLGFEGADPEILRSLERIAGY